MIRLLLDQGLPRSAAGLLRDAGIVTLHVGDAGMAQAKDEVIIEFARANAYCIVTLDADFHRLLALAGANTPSVIRIRMQRLKGPDAVRTIQDVLHSVGERLASPCWVTVTSKHFRVRTPPGRPTT
jgi:predicted nuclease of predicted toxin-antitoxin system